MKLVSLIREVKLEFNNWYIYGYFHAELGDGEELLELQGRDV
jgi:hypothetical protein